jgi:glyoxylase-like metal-dependent hydrolase (beta-lactamase superfamily II)
VRVLSTPGHCANHLAFGLEGTGGLLTGDHIMGWNSTLIATPDGSLAAYLRSLEKVMAAPYDTYHPAHGGPVADGRRHAAALKAHREMRNAQVVAAVERGVTSLSGLVAAIYPELSLALRVAARMTLLAHIEYLAGLQRIALRRSPLGLRVLPLR